MEYVGGGSLSWHLRHGPLPEAKALSIITGIAHALLIAEENSIVHRDIKPDNIILDLRGTAKLADLGLAKNAIDTHTSLTLGGSFMGTPAYMSPEQARDAKIADTRDDIYSLGASFYECLTGEPPFQGETPYNIMSELLTKPSPKPRTVRPEISRAADLICRKMMAKTRSLRYANARALLDDLQICQTFGDSALDRLEASSFDQDSIQASQHARTLGIIAAADGVYDGPDEDAKTGPAIEGARAAALTRRSDSSNVFAVAALLLALVILATLTLVWLGPQHSVSVLKSELAQVTPSLSAPATTDQPKAPEAPSVATAVDQPTPSSASVNPPRIIRQPFLAKQRRPGRIPSIRPSPRCLIPKAFNRPLRTCRIRNPSPPRSNPPKPCPWPSPPRSPRRTAHSSRAASRRAAPTSAMSSPPARPSS